MIGRALSRVSGLQARFSTSLPVIQTVGVIGAGQMGGGIAQVASMVGKKNVILVDSRQAQLDNSVALMDKLMKKNVEKGKLTNEEREATLSRIQKATSIAQLAQADIIIEAATEDEALKKKIFREISDVAKGGAILATNTSSISITKIAAVAKTPDRVIGMHFMNPVPVMQLVEIIPGLQTSEETRVATVQLAEEFGKTCSLSKDMPGFIANRLLMPYINEACQALQEGLGTREDIDKTLKLGCNMPMGPLTLADFIGLDTCLSIMRVLHTQLGEDKYRPSPLLIKMVDAGWLGRKINPDRPGDIPRGFYEYPPAPK